MDRSSFYNRIRPLFGKITPGQFDGMEALLNEWDRRGLSDLHWLAYIMATVYHESKRTMQAIEEDGKGKGKAYGKKMKYGNGPGKRIPYTTPDQIYYGRGPTQNTWFEIYEKLTIAAKKQGHDWDFLNHPELLLQLEPGAWAAIQAMTTGLYTGRKLSQYFNDRVNDPLHARAIVNAEDRAELIEGYYYKFLNALQA